MLLRALEILARRRRLKGRGGPIWTAAALGAFLIRAYQRREARESISLREELRPGESLLITHTRQPRG
ncbi:MAG TPA: hypothetical protein VIR58_08860 [Acidimicrobiales bacterium]